MLVTSDQQSNWNISETPMQAANIDSEDLFQNQKKYRFVIQLNWMFWYLVSLNSLQYPYFRPEQITLELIIHTFWWQSESPINQSSKSEIHQNQTTPLQQIVTSLGQNGTTKRTFF